MGEQKEFREETVVRTLKEQGFQLEQFQAIAPRGGNCRPVPGGIYRINEAMLEDTRVEDTEYMRQESVVKLRLSWEKNSASLH